MAPTAPRSEPISRPRAIVVLLATFALLGLVATWRMPIAAPSLQCPDGGRVQLGRDGVSSCEPGAELPAGQALALGQRFDCNKASEADLSLIPGIGPALARQLVEARDGGFLSWEQLDAVPGVGAARLSALRTACDISSHDSGVW